METDSWGPSLLLLTVLFLLFAFSASMQSDFSLSPALKRSAFVSLTFASNRVSFLQKSCLIYYFAVYSIGYLKSTGVSMENLRPSDAKVLHCFLSSMMGSYAMPPYPALVGRTCFTPSSFTTILPCFVEVEREMRESKHIFVTFSCQVHCL